MKSFQNTTCTGILALSVMLAGARAHAADEPVTGIPESSIAKNFPDNLDRDGRRAALAKRGVTYGINYTGEVFGNADGGIKTGARYSGLLETVLDVDFEKLNGWKGLTFHTSAYQIHGRGISLGHVGLLNAVSNIEATPATRLFELWVEQDLVKEKLTLRLGQMRVDYDGEFINSQTAGLFLNTALGWPVFLGSNLPAGGVTFPLAGLGARLKYTPSDKWTILAAVFNDDPAGPCAGDSQVCNNDGLKLRLKDDPFVVGEVQYKYSDNKKPGVLGGQFKLGAFADFGSFDHKRVGTDGLSLADPASNGIARRLRSNHGVYAVLDQQLYRVSKSGAGPNDGIYAFGRIAGLPADRNLVDFSFDAGLRFAGMVSGRSKDEFGIAISHNRVSNTVAGFDRDTVFFSGMSMPVRSSEWIAELTYKAQLAQGWYIQPDLQYIWRPGGNAADPNVPTKPIDNALVLGLRSIVNY
jgi:porin